MRSYESGAKNAAWNECIVALGFKDAAKTVVEHKVKKKDGVFLIQSN